MQSPSLLLLPLPVAPTTRKEIKNRETKIVDCDDDDDGGDGDGDDDQIPPEKKKIKWN